MANNAINLAAVEEQLTSIELLLKELRKRVAEVAEAVRIAAEHRPNGNGAHASRNGRKKR